MAKHGSVVVNLEINTDKLELIYNTIKELIDNPTTSTRRTARQILKDIEAELKALTEEIRPSS